MRQTLLVAGPTLLVFVLTMGLPGPLIAAQPADRWEGVVTEGESRVTARLLVHEDDVDSDHVRAGVLFELDPGWHIYWHRSGDTGMPTRLRWSIEGGRAGVLNWPAPSRFREDGFETFGYEDRVLLAARIERAGAEPLESAQVEVDLLACRNRCIPAHFTLQRSLKEGSRDGAARVAFASLLTPGSQGRDRLDPPTPTPTPTPTPSTAPAIGLLRALLFAWIGGLILNVMPCVLPVLAIKLVSLSELARRSRGEMLRQTSAYTAGALVTMMLFAGTVAGLRAAGASVGWGFQFQEPRFVAALCALLVIFAANLFGAFEIRVGFGRLADAGMEAVGARRSFFDGLLVVILATPCSAPFLGTAVGFAFVSSASVIFAVFAAIGFGLTAPHWIVAAVPACARWLPRAGPWMVHLRTGLGFGLLATVLWLLAVLSNSLAVDSLLGFAALLLAICVTAWLGGLLQRGGHHRSTLTAAGATFALAVFGLFLVGSDVRQGGVRESKGVEAMNEATTFDAESVRAKLEQGQPVFVYFTADWCITCKVNERVVLSQRRVRDALDRLDVAVFRGDWTNRDEVIRAELERHGKAGVPVYLVYHPDAPEDPEVLPELLTVNLVVDALSAAARQAGPI